MLIGEHNCPKGLSLKYQQFRKYCESKGVPWLNATDKEMILNVCKDYNIKPQEAFRMYEYELNIYLLIKEKEAFESWWNINSD